jgi:5-methyltetrahydropteroyltriglutamate--homocysteine methyltransferase
LIERIRLAAELFNPHRLMLNPDCGFATFATCPLAGRDAAMARMRLLADCAAQVRRELGL